MVAVPSPARSVFWSLARSVSVKSPYAQPPLSLSPLLKHVCCSFRFWSGVSAILGDEMGLGKTLQTIAVRGAHFSFATVGVCSPATMPCVPKRAVACMRL